MPQTRGYYDLQVNGYAGVDFNQDDLTPEQLHTACQRLSADGVAGFLPTIITEEPDLMCRRLATLARLRGADALAQQLIPGLHIEGPFLNPSPGYRGAHPASAIRPPDPDLMQRLLDSAAGLVRLVTLAPEQDPDLKVIRFLARRGVTISAGHTDATLDQLTAAIDAGLTLFTHLGNGCPMLLPRHDNIIQRALSLHDRLWLGFIADGVHVPFVALGNYLRAAGVDRCFIVTDAMPAAGMGPGRYTLGRWDLLVGPDLVARAPDGSHLVGSCITMPESSRRLRQHVRLTAAEILQLTTINPRRALSL